MNELKRQTMIERTATNGQTIKVDLVLQDDGVPWVQSFVDGKTVATVLGLGELPSPKFTPSGTAITHYTGRASQAIGISDAEAKAIKAAQDDLRAYYATTPDGLLSQRRLLVDEIKWAGDVDREDRERAWEREDEAGWAHTDADGAIAAARKALADFDAAHPEVLAAWDEAEERRRNAMLADQMDYRGE